MSLMLALLLTHCVYFAFGASVSGDVMEVQTVSGEDCPLRCTAKSKQGVEYSAVRWYKQLNDAETRRLRGLMTRDLPNGTTRWYTGVGREVELIGDSFDIVLPNVTCDDTGVYVCHLAAPVGEQNQEGQVLLTLADCSNSSEEIMMTDTFLVIFASVVLMCALIIFLISYGSLKNIVQEKTKPTQKEVLLNSPLKPLEKKDLKLIYTLGPNVSKKPSLKHVCV
ncbi:CD83 antigen [Scomber japonicus]|uniref:CD83 antigen n=1 Tax=Scomber japonicus TaxID=13676 RepID=UPI00230585C6|nr:CD83 antigen [Scomber japonicus]